MTANYLTLTFIIPLRPKATTTNWHLVSKLCLQTIHSCLMNGSPGIRVLIIGHDRPNGLFDAADSRVQFLEAQHPLPSGFIGSVGMLDKWKKVTLGLVSLASSPPDYFMIVDADDLVSRKLYDFVDLNRPRNGLIIKDGYVHRDGSPFVRLLKDTFNWGTNSVIATRAVGLPQSLDEDQVQSCIPLRAGHTIIDHAMRSAGLPLDRVPFPAAVYVGHTEQHSIAIGETQKVSLRQTLGRIKRDLIRIPDVVQLRSARLVLRDFI